jgi:uncharacterized protein
MIRIGVLSDTHITAVNSDFRRIMRTVFHDVDVIFHAGDITSTEVFDYLSDWNLKAVSGNMDDFKLKAVLPDKRVEEIEGIRIGIMHGRGSPEGIEDLVLAEFEDVDLLVFGHSHAPLNTVRKGIRLFNPGSLRGRYSYPGSVGIIEIDGGIRLKHLSVK